MNKTASYILLVLALVYCVKAYQRQFTQGEIKKVYIGCYRDDKQTSDDRERALPVTPGKYGPSEEKFDDGNIDTCLELCYLKKASFAALQNGDLCYCGNNYDKYGALDESECNMPCRPAGEPRLNEKVNSLESCGGRWANAVYSLHGDPFLKKRTSIPKPDN